MGHSVPMRMYQVQAGASNIPTMYTFSATTPTNHRRAFGFVCLHLMTSFPDSAPLTWFENMGMCSAQLINSILHSTACNLPPHIRSSINRLNS